MPRSLVVAVLGLCALPFVFNLLGVDFGSSPETLAKLKAAAATMRPAELNDRMHQALAGSFIHTVLEWSACLTAAFTVIFAFAHFVIKRDVSTHAICLAMFWAASMDTLVVYNQAVDWQRLNFQLLAIIASTLKNLTVQGI